ncbi:MAG TPA: CaiB/BaiF CoA-transferase family protein [Bacillota bacterium]|nr:CaiB/BaiF CoA-transferase family protein [Bacillota bacterium]
MAGALEGLKILDFSTLLPGPYATMCMADLGADVLRIVSGSRPDVVELWPPHIPGTKLSAAGAQLGRNKKLMTLNLKDQRALQVIHQLLEEYDIIIEQFRPGVMAKFKLDYESLKAINPRLIYCSLTGYGQTGPMMNRAGHDINYVASSGLAGYSGKRDSGPSLNGMQLADVAAGSNNAIIGILAAVIYRERTGKGQYIDVSMVDGLFAFNAMQGAAYLLDGQNPGREETLLNGGYLYDYYQTKDGKYISFGGIEPQFFGVFCQVIGRPDLAAGGIQPKDGARVKEEVQAILKTKTQEDWLNLFKDADACFEPVLTLGEAMESPLVRERNLLVEVPGQGDSKIKQIANPIKFSESAPEYRHIGLTAAQANTQDIMRGLGYSQEEIEEFAKTGLFS